MRSAERPPRSATSLALLLGLTLSACGGDGAREQAAESLAPPSAVDALPGASDTEPGTTSPSLGSATPTSAATTGSPRTPATPRPIATTSTQAGTGRTTGPTAAPTPKPTRTAASATPTRSPSARPTTPGPGPGTAVALRIVDFRFDPADLTVSTGTTVRATNEDEATHDWTSRAMVWGSGDLDKGQGFSYTFRTPGRFDYVCSIHPSMEGSVTVR